MYRVDRELVAALLKKGARANVVNKYGASPLAEAVRVANLEMVGMLLEAGADANVANEDGQTALMLAARTGNVARGQDCSSSTAPTSTGERATATSPR